MSRPIKIQQREHELAEVAEAYREKLLSVIRRKIRDQVEAEDVYQDVFAEFIAAYDLDHAIESLGAWLFRVAQNKILDRFRRNKTRNQYANAILRGATGEEDNPVHRPDEELANARLRSQIVDALASLPAEQRDVFVKHELEGKSFEEIASATGVSVNTLLARKRYAVLFLRNYLKEVYDELE